METSFSDMILKCEIQIMLGMIQTTAYEVHSATMRMSTKYVSLALVICSTFYLHLKPQFNCDSTVLHGPTYLVISDLHVHPSMPFLGSFWDYRMQTAIQIIRQTWPSIQGTLVLGDLMHWAGGLTFHDRNLSAAAWQVMVERVKWVVGDDNAIYIPGNHDLNDTDTERWNTAFGSYNREIQLFDNITAYLASSMAPKPHVSTVVLAHYPIQNAHDILWHTNLQLALNGHVHSTEHRHFNQTQQFTLPTINPFQATSNNHFDGSGEQGFALLDASLHVCMCQVYILWP